MKRFCALILVLCGMLLGTSCAEPAPQKDEKQAVQLTFMLPQSHYKEFLKDELERFEKEYPYISIEPQIVPDNQWNTLVKRKVAVGETPDLIRIDKGLLANIGTEHFVELTEEEPWYSRVLPEQMEAKTVGNKLYGLPIGGSSCTGLVCNAELFEKCNVKLPETMDEFMAACEQFEEEGITPLYVSDREAWTIGLSFETTAPQAVSADEWNQLKVGTLHWQDVPQFRQILSFFTELREKGYTNENRLEATYASAVDAMAQGNTAMYISGQYFIQDVQEVSPSLRLRMMAVPYEGNALALKAGRGQIAVFKNTKHLEEVKLFLNWFSQPENMNEFSAGWGHSAVYCDQVLEQAEWEKDVQQRYLQTGNTVHIMSGMLGGIDFANFWDCQQDLMAGVCSETEALERWDKSFQTQLEKGIFESSETE